MTAHLPECIYEPEHWDVEQSILWGGKPCICPAISACEQRSYALGIEVGKHDGWVAGHAAGVQAARDAVAAAYDDERYAHRDNWGVSVVYKDLMLAATDALRGEPNE